MNSFQKAITYLKEINEMGLYGSLSQTRWFMFLRNTSLYFITFPFLSLLMLMDALINFHTFLKAKNKNIDSWIGLIGSLTSAGLGNIALVGAVIASAKGMLFVAGPFIFIASLAILIIQQTILLTLNLIRFREAKPSSVQQFNYAKRIINNLFSLTLLSAAVSTALLTFIFPGILPIIGTACAVLTFSLIASNIGWRVIPYHWKNILQKPLKNFFGIDEKVEYSFENPLEFKTLPSADKIVKHRLFSSPDFISPMLILNAEQRKDFLAELIEDKFKRLFKAKDSPKIHQKINLLYDLSVSIKSSDRFNESLLPSKSEISHKYPYAFESFFADVGEVEAIVDAFCFYQIERNATLNTTNINAKC